MTPVAFCELTPPTPRLELPPIGSGNINHCTLSVRCGVCDIRFLYNLEVHKEARRPFTVAVSHRGDFYWRSLQVCKGQKQNKDVALCCHSHQQLKLLF